MKTLWVFENRLKLDRFISILDAHSIPSETKTEKGKEDSENGIVIAVDEKDFAKAKALLLKHRKRRTSGDLF